MAKEDWPDWIVYIRDKISCVYCGLDGNLDFRIWQQLVIDHLIPKDQGGEDVEENKVVSCTRCNSLKQNQWLSTTDTKPKNDTHRLELIDEGNKLIMKKLDRNDERADYKKMLEELKTSSKEF